MNLNDVNTDVETNRGRKRIGRGLGSGWGKTAGKGHKGHKSRSGYWKKPTFQGGMMPMVRRIPKRGFFNKFASDVFSVNVGDLEPLFETGTEITPELLQQTGIIKCRFDELKILGDGDVTKKFKVVAHRVSESAKQKIEAAGGSVTIVKAKRTPEERVADKAKG
jgi:large subunit ribosomal protein L15